MRNNNRKHNVRVAISMVATLCIVLLSMSSVCAEAPAQKESDFKEQFITNLLSTSTVLAAMASIVAIIGKVFKPVKAWAVKRMRKTLQIVDVNQKMDDKFDAIEKRVNEHAEQQRKEYAVVAGQNASIERTMDAIMVSIECINNKMINVEDSQRAVLKDAITKTYYKYLKRKAIPIHEKENIKRMYEIYDKMDGNSYVEGIIEKIDTWEELSGDDVPYVANKQPSGSAS